MSIKSNYIDQKHSFSFEDLEDILERQKFNVEILDEEYLNLCKFLNSIKYFNKRDNKYYTFNINNSIENIKDVIINMNEYYVKNSRVSLFYYLNFCSEDKIIRNDLVKLYEIFSYLINIDKAEENLTENFNEYFGNVHKFIRNFNISLIDNDEYVIEGINDSINRMKKFKYVFDNDLTKSLTDDLIYLKNKIK